MNTLHLNTIKRKLNMKQLFFLASLFLTTVISAQTTNMFVVYSIKGNVTVVENNDAKKIILFIFCCRLMVIICSVFMCLMFVMDFV